MSDFNEALDDLSETPPLDRFVFCALGGSPEKKTVSVAEMRKKIGGL